MVQICVYRCPSVSLSGIFDNLPNIGISRNMGGICTLNRVVSGPRSQGQQVKVTVGQKIVVFGRFFVL